MNYLSFPQQSMGMIVTVSKVAFWDTKINSELNCFWIFFVVFFGMKRRPRAQQASIRIQVKLGSMKKKIFAILCPFPVEVNFSERR